MSLCLVSPPQLLENLNELPAPPLDFSPRNSSSILESPSKTPPAAHSTPSRSSFRPVTSPAVELKGWFNNLFSWKSSDQYVFYSVYDTSRTRKEITRTLESFGITFESSGLSSVDMGQTEGLRCRLDFGGVDFATGNIWKAVKFRIEFLAGSSDSPLSQEDACLPNSLAFVSSSVPPRGRVTSLIGKPASSGVPVPSPALVGSIQLPPGYASSVILVHEKGSGTTFKAIWKRLKELHEDTSLRRLSPTPTPVTGNIQRFTLN